MNNKTGVLFQGVEGGTVMGNSISLSNEHGITMDNSGFVSINGNNIYKNNKREIFLYKRSNNVIENNVILNNGQSNSEYGIYLTSSSTHNLVAGNRIADNQETKTQKGIYINADYNYIFNNNLQDNLETAVKVTINGKNSKIRGNIGYVTENAGKATIDAVNAYVNVYHGLSNTPLIQCCPVK